MERDRRSQAEWGVRTAGLRGEAWTALGRGRRADAARDLGSRSETLREAGVRAGERAGRRGGGGDDAQPDPPPLRLQGAAVAYGGRRRGRRGRFSHAAG